MMSRRHIEERREAQKQTREAKPMPRERPPRRSDPRKPDDRETLNIRLQKIHYAK